MKIGLIYLNIILIFFSVMSCKERDWNNPDDYVGFIPMIKVKGGYFYMGSDTVAKSEPRHLVYLNNFKISKYEINNKTYANYLNSINCSSNGICSGKKYLFVDSSGITFDNGKFKSVKKKENHPVKGVTWIGAKNFCNWAQGSLPTEAEWEYSAMGGRKQMRFRFSGSNNPSKVGWFNKDNVKPVGQKKPNTLGIYDMTGNVSEWTIGSNYQYTKDPKFNPGKKLDSLKVLRGGSVNQKKVSIKKRIFRKPISKHGFRIVRK